jgi:transcriptional regulator with XRE-family HTH domain
MPDDRRSKDRSAEQWLKDQPMSREKGGLGLTDQIREAIRASGQSLNELSRLSGVHNAQLSRFMRGERGLSLAAADKVCGALGLTLVGTKRVKKPRTEKKRRRKLDAGE